MTTPTTVRDLIIVGSGPAGYTAAVYAARAELQPLLFEGTQFGGALMTTTEVENFPGFRDGIMGPDLMEEMREQAKRFGADIRSEDVDELDLSGRIKKVTVGGEVYEAYAVILAMGSAARYLNVPGEQKLLGRGVSACATCDGFFFKGQDIVVVGGGDSAMEEATFLTKFAASVTVIHRREEFRASRIMLERAKANEKIRFLLNSEVAQVHGDSAVTSLTIRDTRTGETSELAATGLFVAIGHDPRSELVRDQVELDDEGYVKVGGQSTYTSVSGVFAAGDLVDHTYRQAITAAGTGCRSAIDAERWLADQGDITTNTLEHAGESVAVAQAQSEAKKPSVLFVCVKNGGKSQMAAGLMRLAVGDRVDVYSAGTKPGAALNAQSVESLLELGADISGETPKLVDPQLVRDVDVVVTLGREAHVDLVPGTRFENWDTDEPSERGIEGIERMRLVRDDIAARVQQLAQQLGVTASIEESKS